MKLFLDTADVSVMSQWLEAGILDGVTTNPTHLADVGADPVKIIKEISVLLGNRSVSVEVTEIEPEAVYVQAKKIAALGNNIAVKIPCHLRYYGVIKKLVDEGVSLNVTLVFTLAQGMCMCKLGVDYISPFVGRLDDIDTSGIKLVEDLIHMRDNYVFDTKILAASIRSIDQLHEVIIAGADIATVPASVLEKAVKHPLTDQGLDMFLADWKKLGIKIFP